jgi:hypothetical protein
MKCTVINIMKTNKDRTFILAEGLHIHCFDIFSICISCEKKSINIKIQRALFNTLFSCSVYKSLSVKNHGKEELITLSENDEQLEFNEGYKACVINSGRGKTIPFLLGSICPNCKQENGFTFQISQVNERMNFMAKLVIFSHFILPVHSLTKSPTSDPDAS